MLESSLGPDGAFPTVEEDRRQECGHEGSVMMTMTTMAHTSERRRGASGDKETKLALVVEDAAVAAAGVDDVAGEAEVGRLEPVPDEDVVVVGFRRAVPVLGDEVEAGVAEVVARGVEEDADAVLGAHLVHEDGPGLQLFQKVPLRVARQRRLEQMHVPGALVHQAHRRRPARPVLRRRPHGQREREALAPERSAIQAVQVRKHDVRVR
mmetsp:Transcript_23224/g.71418  ORF Transcript_23224/g.71418 Transcript_23224/m.71418 type:complete len:209 (-) Transcript_23224:440-1066(-)